MLAIHNHVFVLFFYGDTMFQTLTIFLDIGLYYSNIMFFRTWYHHVFFFLFFFFSNTMFSDMYCSNIKFLRSCTIVLPWYLN